MGAKLIARHPNHTEPLAGKLIVQGFETGVLRCESALGCHIDHEHDFVRNPTKHIGAAGKPLDFHIENGHSERRLSLTLLTAVGRLLALLLHTRREKRKL